MFYDQVTGAVLGRVQNHSLTQTQTHTHTHTHTHTLPLLITLPLFIRLNSSEAILI